MAMASTSKHFFFFLLFLIISSAHIEARVNKFFSKFIHTDHNEVQQLTPSDPPLAPSTAPSVSALPEISPIISPSAEAPSPIFDESQNAYGLYGRDSDDGERSRTITDVEEEILAENSEESTKSGYSETNLQKDNFGSPRRYEQYQKNYENNNGYRNSEYENKEYRNSNQESNFENNEYRNSNQESNFENNGERNYYQYQSNFEDSGYRQRRYEPSERQGMSDTRFMENGRYFHDINSRNGEEGESYGKKKNQYEFDSMEEYEKSEGFLP